MLPRLSDRSSLLQHFKIRLLLTGCCRNSFRKTLRKIPQKKLKCCIVGKFSVEESAISSKRGLNDDFVEQFSAPNIELTTSNIDGWFHADGPGCEYLDEQGIVYFVSVAEGNECDKEKDANENTQHSTQKAQMLFFSCRGNVNV